MFQRNQPNWGGNADNSLIPQHMNELSRRLYSLEQRFDHTVKQTSETVSALALERRERKANLKTFTEHFTQGNPNHERKHHLL